MDCVSFLSTSQSGQGFQKDTSVVWGAEIVWRARSDVYREQIQSQSRFQHVDPDDMWGAVWQSGSM